MTSCGHIFCGSCLEQCEWESQFNVVRVFKWMVPSFKFQVSRHKTNCTSICCHLFLWPWLKAREEKGGEHYKCGRCQQRCSAISIHPGMKQCVEVRAVHCFDQRTATLTFSNSKDFFTQYFAAPPDVVHGCIQKLQQAYKVRTSSLQGGVWRTSLDILEIVEILHQLLFIYS